ncbi:hypothetical protein Isolate57629_37810 [Mycobacteroides abscessus subsp. abscessus]
MHLLDQNDEDDVAEEYLPLWRRPGSSVEETREEAFQAYINAPNPYFDAIAPQAARRGTTTTSKPVERCSTADISEATTVLSSERTVTQQLPRPATERRIDGSCL